MNASLVDIFINNCQSYSLYICMLLVSIANSCHNCPIDDAPNANTRSDSSVNFCHGLGL